MNLCVNLPETVSYEEGAFTNLGGTALHALRRADPEPGEYVGVIGLGIIGNLTGQISKIAGCRMLGSDLLDSRVELAEETGFDCAVSVTEADFETVAGAFTEGHGLDGGYLCLSGDGTSAFEELFAAMKEAPDTYTMGWVMVVGGTDLSQFFGASLSNIDIRNAARSGSGYHDPNYE